MHRLSSYIWFYVLEKMNTNQAWMDIKVIFSDASVPVFIFYLFKHLLLSSSQILIFPLMNMSEGGGGA